MGERQADSRFANEQSIRWDPDEPYSEYVHTITLHTYWPSASSQCCCSLVIELPHWGLCIGQSVIFTRRAAQLYAARSGRLALAALSRLLAQRTGHGRMMGPASPRVRVR